MPQVDALDVLLHKEKIVPFFQPVISAEKQLVIGYEVLARFQTEKGLESLGWFFQDESIPEEYRLEVDDYVQEMAIEKFVKEYHDVFLFLNYDVQALLKDNGETLLARLEYYVDKGLSLAHVVLELKEAGIHEDLPLLKHLLTYLQSLGIQIAIDNVGTNARNLDRIAFIKPNILKVDLQFLERDALPQLYRDVLYSITLLSRKIGATLLFEGIETFQQLNYAWRNGGRYYQGYYLARPKENFVSLDFCKGTVAKQFHHFIHYERKKIESQIALTEILEQKLKQTFRRVKDINAYDEVVLFVANELQDIIFRVYICDQDGFQQSANAVKTDRNIWEIHPEDKYKNWSWRPYFLENIVRMNVDRRGILSDLYTDIERDEMIRTYSYPIGDGLFLFIDIPYAYLFEQEGLL